MAPHNRHNVVEAVLQLTSMSSKRQCATRVKMADLQRKHPLVTRVSTSGEIVSESNFATSASAASPGLFFSKIMQSVMRTHRVESFISDSTLFANSKFHSTQRDILFVPHQLYPHCPCPRTIQINHKHTLPLSNHHITIHHRNTL